MKSSLITCILLLATLAQGRAYHPVTLANMAQGKTRWTHVMMTATVMYVKLQKEDGDLHIRLSNGKKNGPIVVAECVPEIPCKNPGLGTRITVYGISRKDPLHLWWEIHPVFRLDVAMPDRSKQTAYNGLN